MSRKKEPKMPDKLPSPKEMIEFLIDRCPGGMRGVDQLTGVNYSTLNRTLYHNGNMTIKNYHKVYKVYKTVKNVERDY